MASSSDEEPVLDEEHVLIKGSYESTLSDVGAHNLLEVICMQIDEHNLTDADVKSELTLEVRDVIFSQYNDSRTQVKKQFHFADQLKKIEEGFPMKKMDISHLNRVSEILGVVKDEDPTWKNMERHLHDLKALRNEVSHPNATKVYKTSDINDLFLKLSSVCIDMIKTSGVCYSQDQSYIDSIVDKTENKIKLNLRILHDSLRKNNIGTTKDEIDRLSLNTKSLGKTVDKCQSENERLEDILSKQKAINEEIEKEQGKTVILRQQSVIRQKKLRDNIYKNHSHHHKEHNGLEIRKIITKVDHKDEKFKVQKLSIGELKKKPTKVVLFVGESGKGKSTLINAMVNYIYRVEFKDNFRFIVNDDEDTSKKLRKESKTEWVSVYVLNHIAGMPNDYNYAFIDTPGFHNTGGLQRDCEMMIQLEMFLNQSYGIDSIDAVGFVTEASLLSASQLTVTQRYVYEGLLSMLGKDIKNNLFAMATFADTKKHTMIKDNVDYIEYFKFNNCALFDINCDDGSDCDDDSVGKKHRVGISNLFWDMGYRNMNSFFIKLSKIQQVSLTLTRDILNTRSQLQQVIRDTEENMHLDGDKLDNLQQQAQQHLRRLEGIALKPFPLLLEQDIAQMIESEKHYKRIYYEKRIKQLEKVKEYGVIQSLTAKPKV